MKHLRCDYRLGMKNSKMEEENRKQSTFWYTVRAVFIRAWGRGPGLEWNVYDYTASG